MDLNIYHNHNISHSADNVLHIIPIEYGTLEHSCQPEKELVEAVERFVLSF